jgi:hypothetical protein
MLLLSFTGGNGGITFIESIGLIELRCDKCKNVQKYRNPTLNGFNIVVCDYCSSDIVIRK